MLAWALAVIGLTTIITQSKLFAPVRQVFELAVRSRFLHCPMCVGFWVGLGLSLLHFGCCPGPLWLRPVFDGWASSGLNWIVFVILVRLGSKSL